MPETLVVLNRASGNAGAMSDLQQRIGSAAHEVLTLGPDIHLQAEIQRAVQQGCNLVVAAGGDGTVNAVVNSLMRVDSIVRPRMAILPLGTANDFAFTLDLPTDLQETIALVPDQRNYHDIDIIEIRAEQFTHYFANVAAGGNSVRVSEELTTEIKQRWGPFCYLRGAVNLIGDLQTYNVTAQCDDERFEEIDTWAVLVANGRTNAGHILVAPQASPNDGLMDVILIRNGDMVDIIEMVSEAVFGNYLQCDQIIFRQTKTLVLNSTPGMRFTTDGEIVQQEPVCFGVIPGAIKMLIGPALL